jgi:hypothetical protein
VSLALTGVNIRSCCWRYAVNHPWDLLFSLGDFRKNKRKAYEGFVGLVYCRWNRVNRVRGHSRKSEILLYRPLERIPALDIRAFGKKG